ncbi:MAG: galactose mutarotase [Candidatus Lokiarchaeota archaeon]|nr:galactose mutarotase [Candidatus Lokiarchaeota archaeon]
MKLERKPFGTYKGRPVELFIVTDPRTGFRVDVSDFGATLVRVQVPDKDGKVGDVTFGHDSPDEYMKQPGYLGAVTGRVANRIANGRFHLDGKEYNLPKNLNGKMTLHGGLEGFNKKQWAVAKAEARGRDATVRFEYTSPDGEEGFPGTLKVSATYTISPNKVGWGFDATADKPTIVNITNHAYWNLDGLDALIDDQDVQIEASYYMPGDADNLVTGEVLKLDGSKLDLREFKSFKQLFADCGDIDNSFFSDNYWTKGAATDAVLAGQLRSTKTGRLMRVFTSEPIVHVYTGNYLADVTSWEKRCKKHGAVCFETQRPSNAINHPVFANSVILRPGEHYSHRTMHEFSTG